MKATSLDRKISWPYHVSISDVKTVETNLGDVDFVELRTRPRDVSLRPKNALRTPSENDAEEVTVKTAPSDPMHLGGLVVCSSLLVSATLAGAFFFWTAPYFNTIYGFTMDAGR